MPDYESLCSEFKWTDEFKNLDRLPGGGLNIAYEAVDRHANSDLANTAALRWIRKDRSFIDFTYADLKIQTSRFANVLEMLEIKKNDSVFSLAERIPSLYVAALGTLKTGAVFCPMFSVFGPEPAFQRLSKGKAKVLITTTKLYQKKIKQLMPRLPLLRHILLTDAKQHIGDEVLSLSLLMDKAPDEYLIQNTQPEDPALLHFTSGTTGMPKGALHVHQAVLTHYVTGKYVLDLQPGDIFWCTADPGWVTGTSYGIIAPLVNGVTNIIDEEEFDTARWYSILEEHQVNVWYTAPTAIRRLMRLEYKPLEKYDLSNLRLIHSVGEPLQAEEVIWGKKTFGMPICELYEPNGDGGWNKRELGYKVPLKERQYKDLYQAFSITKDGTYYARFLTHTPPVPVNLWKEASFLLKSNRQLLTFGLYTGILLFVINAVTDIPLREIISEIWAFLAVLVGALVVMMLSPDLVLWLPRLLGYQG